MHTSQNVPSLGIAEAETELSCSVFGETKCVSKFPNYNGVKHLATFLNVAKDLGSGITPKLINSMVGSNTNTGFSNKLYLLALCQISRPCKSQYQAFGLLAYSNKPTTTI